MKYLLLLCTLLSMVEATAQNCYTELLNNGITAFDALDFERAINQFKAAKICDDAPQDGQINDWINKSQSGYITAIKAARDEALQLKSEALALRFFVKGQEREFKGFYLEAMDNYDICVQEQPLDTLFRERRAQLAMSEEVAQFDKAEEDLRFLILNGNTSKKAEYNDDLAYVLEKLDDFTGALVAQTSAADFVQDEQKERYNSKVIRLKNKNTLGSSDGPNSPIQSFPSLIKVRKNKEFSDCYLGIILQLDGKQYPLIGGQIMLDGLEPGTYTYEISGTVQCEDLKKWPALGKGSMTVRSNTVYYLYWEKTKYGKCDMWINNY